MHQLLTQVHYRLVLLVLWVTMAQPVLREQLVLKEQLAQVQLAPLALQVTKVLQAQKDR